MACAASASSIAWGTWAPVSGPVGGADLAQISSSHLISVSIPTDSSAAAAPPQARPFDRDARVRWRCASLPSGREGLETSPSQCLNRLAPPANEAELGVEALIDGN